MWFSTLPHSRGDGGLSRLSSSFVRKTVWWEHVGWTDSNDRKKRGSKNDISILRLGPQFPPLQERSAKPDGQKASQETKSERPWAACGQDLPSGHRAVREIMDQQQNRNQDTGVISFALPLSTWSWANYLTFLDLRFLLSKISLEGFVVTDFLFCSYILQRYFWRWVPSVQKNP